MKKINTAVQFLLSTPQGIKLILVLLVCLCITNVSAQNYYVSASGSDSNSGLSTSSPFKTIQKAADKVNAGGTVFIMNGRYSRTTSGSVLEFRRSGTASAYITFKPLSGHNPVISSSGSSWNAVIIDGSYVILEGLEFAGINSSLTLTGARDAYAKSYGSPAVFNANYNTNAMSIGATGSSTPHHVIVRNCRVHDFPGGGIGVGKADYVTIDDNVVYNNSWFTMYATSGISVLGPRAIDGVTTRKIFIRRNTVYNNFTQVKWRRGNQSTDKLSDGNGIILDVNSGYTGRTLVENNVSYNNGGGGIQAFRAAHIDIINNTAYSNGKVVGYAEISAVDASDCKIYNNIMYARNGGGINSNYSNVNVTYDWNLYYNGTPEIKGPNDKTGNPQFVKLAQDGSANFRIQSISPARDAGSWSYYSLKDKVGVTRGGSRPDMGAYEFQASGARLEQEESLTQTEETPVDNTGYAVYPNPASHEVYVKIQALKGEGIFANIVSLQGSELSRVNKVAEQDGVNTIQMNVENLSKGTYLVRYGSQSKTKSRLLLISR